MSWAQGLDAALPATPRAYELRLAFTRKRFSSRSSIAVLHRPERAAFRFRSTPVYPRRARSALIPPRGAHGRFPRQFHLVGERILDEADEGRVPGIDARTALRPYLPGEDVFGVGNEAYLARALL